MLSRDKDFKSGPYIEAYGINSCNFDEKLKLIFIVKVHQESQNFNYLSPKEFLLEIPLNYQEVELI